PTFGGAGARIVSRPGVAGGNYLACFLDRRRPELDGRHVRRPGGLTRAVGDELLHDPVFERMKGDDHQPAARLERALGCEKSATELAQLVVDEDAQALKRARRWVDLVLRIVAERALDRIGEVAGTLEGTNGAPLFDQPRDAARVALFAEHPDDARQIAHLEAVDNVGSARPFLRHAHVERAIAAERKSALGLVELHGGDADVQHYAVDRLANYF